MDDLRTAIRKIAIVELDAVQRQLSQGTPGKHADRLARQQRGEAVYLIAWQDHIPVGHVLIKWPGEQTESIAAALEPCPELEDFYVSEAFRRHGIGSSLLQAAEHTVWTRGFGRLGLGIGLTPDYALARCIYERRGYCDSGLGVYVERWSYHDDQERERWWEEPCIYLVKHLASNSNQRPG